MTSFVFRDNGYTPGDDFRLALLRSPAFTVKALSRLLPRGKKTGEKDELAQRVAEALDDDEGTLLAEDVVCAMAAQSCRYLAMRKLERDQHEYLREMQNEDVLPELGDAAELLTSFGGDGWHGPLTRTNDDGGEDVYYLYTQRVLDLDDATPNQPLPPKRFLRWTIAAQMHEGAFSFHWDGLSHAEERKKGSGVRKVDQFRFWDFVDQAIATLADELSVTWQPVRLPELVYQTLWDQYESDPGHHWQHLQINAERDGVAVEAQSSHKVDVDGLRALTKVIASKVVQSSQWDLSTERDTYEGVILQTLLREWGTKSYGFRLGTKAGNTRIHARFYMGTAKYTEGYSPQHSLAHILCYSEAGGSIPAAKFLLDYI